MAGDTEKIVQDLMQQLNSLKMRIQSPGDVIDYFVEEVMPKVTRDLDDALERGMKIVGDIMGIL